MPDKTTYLCLAQETETNLNQQILACWYPRAADATHLGFHEVFDEKWNSIGSSTGRSIVYQARLTWVAAQVALRFPERTEEYRRYTRHGIACLQNLMWDKEQGGFYWQVDAVTGQPSGSRAMEKHVYGNAFAIYACSAAYEATHDAAALALAQSAFLWLEKHVHDWKNGGYYEAFTRDGQPILTPPRPGTGDAIGTQYGYKSMNSHIHLLEALAELYRVWPDPNLKVRLEEVFHIVRDRVYVDPGCLNMYFNPDWRPVPNYDSFGHDIETAYLLVEAASVLGQPDDAATWTVARHLVDHTLEVGWDTQYGGIYDHGVSWGPPIGTEKVWWTQAEGLNALLLMHTRYGKETSRYFDAFVEQWAFIQQKQIDPINGGWYTSVTREGTAPSGQSKSDPWKDPYHQGRALLHVSEMLRHLAEQSK